MNQADELAALRARVRELEETNRQKDQLFGILAHDLRSPLSAIRSASEVLMLTLGKEPRVQRAHAILDRQTTQMTKIIERISDLSQLFRGTLSLERQPVDLVEISRRALDEHAERLASADLKLERELPPDAIWVNADGARLSQVFEGLFADAIKFGRPSGVVRVTVEKNETQAIVKMTRDGDRTDPTLGVMLARGLIELHGGTMTATAEPGQSAKYELRIPIAP